MKPTLPLKEGSTYRTNRKDKIVTLKRTDDCSSSTLWAPEVGLYFRMNKLRAPSTDCEIIEELISKPSSLTREEMMQRLDALERREET